MGSNHKNNQSALNTVSLASAPKESVFSADNNTNSSEVGQRSCVLPEKYILEFQTLYLKHFGKDIDKKEALKKGFRLIQLMEAVLKNSTDK